MAARASTSARSQDTSPAAAAARRWPNCVIQPRHSPATVSRRSGDAAGRCAPSSRRRLTSPPPGARRRPSPTRTSASGGRRRRRARPGVQGSDSIGGKTFRLNRWQDGGEPVTHAGPVGEWFRAAQRRMPVQRAPVGHPRRRRRGAGTPPRGGGLAPGRDRLAKNSRNRVTACTGRLPDRVRRSGRRVLQHRLPRQVRHGDPLLRGGEGGERGLRGISLESPPG